MYELCALNMFYVYCICKFICKLEVEAQVSCFMIHYHLKCSLYIDFYVSSNEYFTCI